MRATLAILTDALAVPLLYLVLFRFPFKDALKANFFLTQFDAFYYLLLVYGFHFLKSNGTYVCFEWLYTKYVTPDKLIFYLWWRHNIGSFKGVINKVTTEGNKSVCKQTWHTDRTIYNQRYKGCTALKFW